MNNQPNWGRMYDHLDQKTKSEITREAWIAHVTSAVKVAWGECGSQDHDTCTWEIVAVKVVKSPRHAEVTYEFRCTSGQGKRNGRE